MLFGPSVVLSVFSFFVLVPAAPVPGSRLPSDGSTLWPNYNQLQPAGAKVSKSTGNKVVGFEVPTGLPPMAVNDNAAKPKPKPALNLPDVIDRRPLGVSLQPDYRRFGQEHIKPVAQPEAAQGPVNVPTTKKSVQDSESARKTKATDATERLPLDTSKTTRKEIPTIKSGVTKFFKSVFKKLNSKGNMREE